jgi:molybdopterin synthase catalytic subunit
MQEVAMDINKTLQELKARPGFAEHVGMTLVHNGVVRAWSRKDHSPVSQVRVTPDRAKMSAICREMEQRPGIFAILAESAEGLLRPGDDLLFLVVAGDIREHVKATFAELLDRIKAEAVLKQEYGQD